MCHAFTVLSLNYIKSQKLTRSRNILNIDTARIGPAHNLAINLSHKHINGLVLDGGLPNLHLDHIGEAIQEVSREVLSIRLLPSLNMNPGDGGTISNFSLADRQCGHGSIVSTTNKPKFLETAPPPGIT